MTADADVIQEPTPVHRRPGVWWRVLRAVLVALWLAWATTAWWTEPGRAHLRDAEEDLWTHRVAAVCWGDRWQGPPGVGARITQSRLVDDSADVDRIFAWRTTSGRVYYTNVDEPGPVNDGVADSPSAELARKVLVPALAGLNVTEECDSLRPSVNVPAVFALLLGLTSLVLLVRGPAPVLGTRWFWFWIIGGAPFGLGVLAWLARERPWFRAATPPPSSDSEEPRRRWLTGLLLAIVAWIVVGIAVYAGDRVFGD